MTVESYLVSAQCGIVCVNITILMIVVVVVVVVLVMVEAVMVVVVFLVHCYFSFVILYYSLLH